MFTWSFGRIISTNYIIHLLFVNHCYGNSIINNFGCRRYSRFTVVRGKHVTQYVKDIVNFWTNEIGCELINSFDISCNWILETEWLYQSSFMLYSNIYMVINIRVECVIIIKFENALFILVCNQFSICQSQL